MFVFSFFFISARNHEPTTNKQGEKKTEINKKVNVSYCFCSKYTKE